MQSGKMTQRLLSVVIVIGMVVLNTPSAVMISYNETKESISEGPLPTHRMRLVNNTPFEEDTKNASGTTELPRQSFCIPYSSDSTTETTTSTAGNKSEGYDEMQYSVDDLYGDPSNETIFNNPGEDEMILSEDSEHNASHTQANESTTDSSTNTKNTTDGTIKLEFGNKHSENHSDDDSQSSFNGFKGDLVGWRKVDIREFPYIVSLMHEKYKVHICTGTLLTSKVVLSYIRCVVRRKSVADKVVFTVAEAYQIIIAAGMDSVKNKEESSLIYREVDIIITTYNNAFKGRLVFLMLNRPVPYSIYHHPVKMYSMDFNVVGKKLQEYVGKSFCEVLTWDDTIICSNSKIKKPRHLKAYRVKILESEVCLEQDFRLGVRSIGEWTIKSTNAEKHCFVGMGGRRCGSAPGGPVICGNSVYGIMSLGTACSEFGDYTFFVSLNETEMYLLYKQTIALESGRERKSQGCVNTALWFLTIPVLCVYLYTDGINI